MKREITVLSVLGIALAMFPALGFANKEAPIPKPKPAANSQVPFKITSQKRTSQNRLIIPRKFLENAKTAGVFGSSDGGNNIRTVIAGIAISISLVAFVFLLIRKKSRVAQAMALFVALGAGGFLWVEQANADIAPPTTDVVRSWGRVGKGQHNVIIEITNKGDSVELVLGAEYAGQSRDPRDRAPKPE